MEPLIVALYIGHSFIGARDAIPTYNLACKQWLKELGVEEKYIGVANAPLRWYSADEIRPYSCIPMRPLDAT